MLNLQFNKKRACYICKPKIGQNGCKGWFSLHTELLCRSMVYFAYKLQGTSHRQLKLDSDGGVLVGMRRAFIRDWCGFVCRNCPICRRNLTNYKSPVLLLKLCLFFFLVLCCYRYLVSIPHSFLESVNTENTERVQKISLFCIYFCVG